jgi:hypothetical protein
MEKSFTKRKCHEKLWGRVTGRGKGGVLCAGSFVHYTAAQSYVYQLLVSGIIVPVRWQRKLE